MSEAAEGGSGARHLAWLYQSRAEYQATIAAFVQAAQARGEPVLVAVPHSQLPQGWQLPAWPAATMIDMTDVGRNPARILPVLGDFCSRYQGQRVCYLGECAWPGRSGAELREAARHEALMNLAFAGADISILCPYNSASLAPSVIEDAVATHPAFLQDGVEQPSHGYLGPAGYLATQEKPLLAPASADMLEYGRDLRPVRVLVATAARRAGLPAERCTDLVIAASEVAANTLRHTNGPGTIRLWRTDTELLCQVDDSGFIADPLVGRRRPAGDQPGGQGLWLVNQVCDLTEIRTSELGTAIRLHMRRPR